jgi:sporulation integral membrane protein YtvI
VFFLGALAVRELGQLAAGVPDMVRNSAGLLEAYLVGLAKKVPEPANLTLTNSIHRLFQNSNTLTQRALQQMPGVLSGVLGKVPGGAMTLGTGILSGYFISARLPQLKERLRQNLPKAWHQTIAPTLTHLKESLGKWLIAQGKLMSVTYGIVALGLTFLKIPYAFAWAVLVAAVDAVPLLGTGTVLLPWALTRLLQGDPLGAAAMAVVYLVAMVTRTVLEPKFFGKHLGLDPLVMLIFLYVGYRLWGFWGIVISPLLAATTKVLTESPPKPSP